MWERSRIDGRIHNYERMDCESMRKNGKCFRHLYPCNRMYSSRTTYLQIIPNPIPPAFHVSPRAERPYQPSNRTWCLCYFWANFQLQMWISFSRWSQFTYKFCSCICVMEYVCVSGLFTWFHKTLVLSHNWMEFVESYATTRVTNHIDWHYRIDFIMNSHKRCFRLFTTRTSTRIQ